MRHKLLHGSTQLAGNPASSRFLITESRNSVAVLPETGCRTLQGGNKAFRSDTAHSARRRSLTDGGHCHVLFNTLLLVSMIANFLEMSTGFQKIFIVIFVRTARIICQ
jgi:hypothetical protein